MPTWSALTNWNKITDFLPIKLKMKWLWKTAVIRTIGIIRIVDKSWHRRKGGFIVCKTCTYDFPNPFRWCHNPILICLQNNYSTRAILEHFKDVIPAKRQLLPCSAMPLWIRHAHKMVHFASLSFARLLPLCVLESVILPTFLPNS